MAYRKPYAKKQNIIKYFIQAYYGDEDKLQAALKADWHAVQYAWSLYTDALCKNGEITLQQYESWLFPWPKKEMKYDPYSCFGKPLLCHHRAENGCEGCKFEARCETARKEMTYADS